MDARSILNKLRLGSALEDGEIAWFAAGLATGEVSDAQAGAFAMGVCLQGLGEAGRVALTKAMRDSGTVLEWDLDAPVADKHSTGGLGDAVSLPLAPALAACGVYVPMISGRGLGHTGGTLDKLEAIPGYQTGQDEDGLRRIVDAVGCAIVSATGEIASADKRLYGVRDISGTVESIDLITASILSKKLAAGLEALVLDVKAGSGAFMETVDTARELAQALVRTANGAGCRTAATLTDMNEPLAPAVGNAVEVAVSLRYLLGDRSAAPRMAEVTEALGGQLLHLAGVADSPEDGTAHIAMAIDDGSAAERFAAMVRETGGPADILASFSSDLPAAPVQAAVAAEGSGFVQAVDGRALGMAVIELGGGRHVQADVVDPSVGLTEVVPIGTEVRPGDPLCIVHAADEAAAAQAVAAVQSAVIIGPEEPPLRPLLIEVIT